MKPVTHRYKEINVGKYKQVRHFELVEYDGQPILTHLVNISTDRQFAKSSPTYWVKNHNGKKWTSAITGLFPIPSQRGSFFGDLRRKRDLVIVTFTESEKGSEMVCFVYENYYPFNKFLNPTQLGHEIARAKNEKSTSRV